MARNTATFKNKLSRLVQVFLFYFRAGGRTIISQNGKKESVFTNTEAVSHNGWMGRCSIRLDWNVDRLSMEMCASVRLRPFNCTTCYKLNNRIRIFICWVCNWILMNMDGDRLWLIVGFYMAMRIRWTWLSFEGYRWVD